MWHLLHWLHPQRKVAKQWSSVCPSVCLSVCLFIHLSNAWCWLRPVIDNGRCENLRQVCRLRVAMQPVYILFLPWTDTFVRCRLLIYFVNLMYPYVYIVPSVLWRCWLGGRKGIRPVKNWVVGCWRGCLGWGADLHMAQQMPLPLTISCSSKSRLVLTFPVLPFWYLLTRVVPDIFQKSSKTVVCVLCVYTEYVCILFYDLWLYNMQSDCMIPAWYCCDRWLTCSASDCRTFNISSRRRRSSSTCWRTAPWRELNSPRLNSCRLTITSQPAQQHYQWY